MYYMPSPFDKVFSFLCILCAFSVGCAMQASAFASSFSQLVPIHKALLILPLLLLMIPVFLKGKSKIFDLAAILVPAMSLLYIAICMCVLFRYKSALPGVFERIFKEAFRFKSIALGAGSGMLTALRLGVVRGILSNEAGCGTAPLAHAATTSESGNAQGSLGVIEVAFDTLLLCSLTGLSLLVYPPALEEHGGMAMLFAVFSSVIGKAALLLLPLSILLFAFATLLCWCYYGRRCTVYLTKNPRCTLFFDLLFSGVLLLSPFLSEGLLLAFCDLVISLMTILNLSALFLHRKEIKHGS
jgi:AGCS family alanine or glycine:cation symporter